MMGTKPCVEPREQSSQSGSALLRTRRTSPLLKLSWPGSVAMWWHNARTSLRNDRRKTVSAAEMMRGANDFLEA